MPILLRIGIDATCTIVCGVSPTVLAHPFFQKGLKDRMEVDEGEAEDGDGDQHEDRFPRQEKHPDRSFRRLQAFAHVATTDSLLQVLWNSKVIKE
jgi:hypothetical protein